MYQQWQNDPSMESVIKLIEERENREIHEQNYNSPRNNESGNWGIMSLRDVNTPTRPPYQNSSTSRGRGVPEAPRRREPESPAPARREEPLGWRTGRELAPVARFGLEIASRLTQQLKVDRRSSSSEDDRRTSRSKRRQDSPDKRKNERKRRSSRSGSEGRKRSRRSRSNSRSRRGRSGSRDKKRYRSRSRERKRERSTERKRDRSAERNSSNKSPPSRERRDLPTATQPKQTAPQTVNDATNEILSKFISIIKDVKEPAQVAQQPQKFPYKDVLPEFDPIDKGNAIVTWITRVDDIAKLFGWEEKEIVQHAMPKLAGLAKVWYLGRKDFVHSWPEWKKKLVEQFPCPDFWQMLEELKQRICGSDETLENYFHDKIILVKRCGIRGRQAVDCVLQGIAEEAVRLFAAAAQFDEPEALLRYLQTAESIRKKVPNIVTPPVATATPTTTATATPTNNDSKPQCSYCNKFGHLEITCHARLAATKKMKKNVPCPNCQKYGHEPSSCWNINKPKQTQQCFHCGKLGHTIIHCRHANKQSQNQKSMVQSQKVEKVKKPKTCFLCGQVGHLKSSCHKVTQKQGTSEGPAPAASVADGAAPSDVSKVGDVTSHEPPPPGVEEH